VRQPDKIVIEESNKTSGRLVLADPAYPGWKVSVDGKPATALVARGIFRAVDVRGGTHTVVWTFEPPRLIIGPTSRRDAARAASASRPGRCCAGGDGARPSRRVRRTTTSAAPCSRRRTSVPVVSSIRRRSPRERPSSTTTLRHRAGDREHGRSGGSACASRRAGRRR